MSETNSSPSSPLRAQLSGTSARPRTEDEMHWSVKIPAMMTLRMPMLDRISRRFVPVSALSGVLKGRTRFLLCSDEQYTGRTGLRAAVEISCEKIQTLADYYPELPLVLVGDSGQHDPEIYLRVIQTHPRRILAAEGYAVHTCGDAEAALALGLVDEVATR